MYDARDQLRYLYGLGGLGDLTFATQTSRTLLTPDQWQAAAARFRGDATPQQVELSNTLQLTQMEYAAQRLLSQSAGGGGGNGGNGGTDSTAVATCDCALAEAASAFQLPADQLAVLQQACLSNPAGFVAELQAQATAAGATLDLARCGKPWYKDPKKLALAAAGGVGAVALIWLVLR